MRSVASDVVRCVVCVCLSVCWAHRPTLQNGWTDRDVVWGAKYCDQLVSLSVCLSVIQAYHKNKMHNTHTRLTGLCPGLPESASTRKVKPIQILLKQETVSGSGISWAICKSAPRCRQITTPAPTTVFYRPGALPATQPTASKYWRHRK